MYEICFVRCEHVLIIMHVHYFWNIKAWQMFNASNMQLMTGDHIPALCYTQQHYLGTKHVCS